MNKRAWQLVEAIGALVLGTVFLLVVWDPVFPSGWIVRKMAPSIDPESLSLEGPVVVRFDLRGKGCGVYHIVDQPEKVEVV